jgi:hypothetical protein
MIRFGSSEYGFHSLTSVGVHGSRLPFFILFFIKEKKIEDTLTEEN